MAALARKITRRSGIRTHFETTLDDVSKYLTEDVHEKAKLLGFKKSLESLVKQLDLIDDEVVKLIDPEQVEADVIESLELIKPVNEVLANIEIKVHDLSINELSPPSITSQSTVSASTSNSCRLPKIDLAIFKEYVFRSNGRDFGISSKYPSMKMSEYPTLTVLIS